MISDSEKLLDNLYNEYETILNTRLDNIDGILSDTLTAINENAGTIAQTINGVADSVGYTMSEGMSGIWEEAKTIDDIDRETRVKQTQEVIDALTNEGALLPSKAQDIIDTLKTGSEAEALATKDLIDQMVANGEITREEANRIVAALSTGDQAKVLDALNMADQLVADGKMTETEANAITNALITGDAQSIKNAENIISQLVSNGSLSKDDSKTITDALIGAKDESVDIVSEYDENFKNKHTEINQAISKIEKNVKAASSDSDLKAQEEISKNATSSSSQKDPTKENKKPSTTTNTNPTKKENPKKENPKKEDPKKEDPPKTTGDGKAKVGDKVKFVSGKYYYSSDGQKPTGTKNQGKNVYITKINNASWATHPYHISTGKKLGSGDLGWLKLKQLSGYASGKKKISDSEYAWTQENGQEFIVRPSDGAILTPVAKGDSVLNATASGNIWSMANNPAEFIKNNLGLDSANVPNGSNVQNSIVQNFENITFSMPNVHGYNDLLKEMKSDSNFERLILSMTIDRIAGRSKLAKGKSIR